MQLLQISSPHVHQLYCSSALSHSPDKAFWLPGLQAFVDHEGSVVLSFDRAAAALEGDLTAYLNHQEKHGSMMVEFR